jgi:hypothetical protein
MFESPFSQRTYDPWSIFYTPRGSQSSIPPRPTRNAMMAVNIFAMMVARAAQASSPQAERKSISKRERTRRRTRVQMQKTSRSRNRRG